MKKYGLWGGFFWLVLGASLCIGSMKLNLGNFRSPGLGFFPFLTGALMGLFGLILMSSTLSERLGGSGAVKNEKNLGKKNWKNLIFPSLALMILFGYTLLLETLGFLFTTFLFLFFLFKLSDPKKWLMPFMVSLSTVILSYLLFYVWLQVRLPKGIFRF